MAGLQQSIEPLSTERAFVELAQRVFENPSESPPFLFSYKNFITPGLSLFNLWEQEFQRLSSDSERKRLLDFLHCWMSQYPTDLSSPEHKRILSLLSTYEAKDEKLISEFKRLISFQNTTTLKRLISRHTFTSSTNPMDPDSRATPPLPSFGGGASPSPASPASSPSKPLRPLGTMRQWINRNLKGSVAENNSSTTASGSQEGREMGGSKPRRSNSGDAGDLSTHASDPALTSWREECVDFLAMPSVDIARELTVLEFELFKNISSRELLNQCWQKGNRNATAPNITKLIVKFNQVSYWVATEILKRSDPREQARVISKFIKIARLCYHMYNFNSLSEILTGLNNSAVIRLKVAWLCVSDRTMKHFQQLDQLMQPQANYLHYRQEIRRLTFSKREKRGLTGATGGVSSSSSSDLTLHSSLSLDELAASTTASEATSSGTTPCESSSPDSSSSTSSKATRLAALAIDQNLPPLPISPKSGQMHKADSWDGAGEDHERADSGHTAAKRWIVFRSNTVGVTSSSGSRPNRSEKPKGFGRSPRSPRSLEIGANRKGGDKEEHEDGDSPARERGEGVMRSATINLGHQDKLPKGQGFGERNKYLPSEAVSQARGCNVVSVQSSSAHAASPAPSGGSLATGSTFAVRGVPPILPYLAIILRDLVAVTEGNAPYHPDGRINAHLIDLQYQIVDELKNFQSNSYNLPRKKEVRRYLENLRYEDDDDLLYSLSLKSCPITQTLASELDGMPSGESLLNPDRAQEYFEATLNSLSDVSAVLSAGESSKRSSSDGRLPSGSRTRERNASLAFYSMLSQGTAGMLEREMMRWKGADGQEEYDQSAGDRKEASRAVSTKESFRSGLNVFDPDNAEERRFEPEDYNSSDSEEAMAATAATSSSVSSPPLVRLSGLSTPKRIRASSNRERPKSLQPCFSHDHSDLNLRDRSNSASTVEKKLCDGDDEESSRRPRKLGKKSKKITKSGMRTSSTGTLDENTLLSGLGKEKSAEEGNLSDGVDSANVVRPRKSLKALKERILSFRGRVEIAKDEDVETPAIVRKSKSNNTSPTGSSISLAAPANALRSIETLSEGDLRASVNRGRRSDADQPPFASARKAVSESIPGDAPSGTVSDSSSVPAPVQNRPNVVTRDRQSSVAFYASLSRGAVVMLQEEGILGGQPK